VRERDIVPDEQLAEQLDQWVQCDHAASPVEDISKLYHYFPKHGYHMFCYMFVNKTKQKFGVRPKLLKNETHLYTSLYKFWLESRDPNTSFLRERALGDCIASFWSRDHCNRSRSMRCTTSSGPSLRLLSNKTSQITFKINYSSWSLTTCTSCTCICMYNCISVHLYIRLANVLNTIYNAMLKHVHGVSISYLKIHIHWFAAGIS